MNKVENNNLNQPVTQTGNANKMILQEYPLYPVKDDIYNRPHEEENIDPEDISTMKVPNADGELNEKEFNEGVSGSDLDVPGSELDDAEEITGSKDEENNQYSLGGDYLNDPEEDSGE